MFDLVAVGENIWSIYEVSSQDWASAPTHLRSIRKIDESQDESITRSP
jgi:hypothetical protein